MQRISWPVSSSSQSINALKQEAASLRAAEASDLSDSDAPSAAFALFFDILFTDGALYVAALGAIAAVLDASDLAGISEPMAVYSEDLPSDCDLDAEELEIPNAVIVSDPTGLSGVLALFKGILLSDGALDVAVLAVLDARVVSDRAGLSEVLALLLVLGTQLSESALDVAVLGVLAEAFVVSDRAGLSAAPALLFGMFFSESASGVAMQGG